MKVVLFGGMGALVNCALALHSSSLSFAHIIDDVLLQPFTAVKTLLLLPAALGFLLGTFTLLFWSFLRAIVLRSLLQYNGWFLRPKSPINKVWYLLMLVLLGRKNLGAGNYQKFLPSLPVPPLRKTCKRFLQSVQPLLTDEQYKKTELVVKNFQAKEGRKLQMYLTLRSWTHRNWISQWWEEIIYFRQRTPISFNSNYYCLGTKEVSTPHQLDRGAMTVHLTAKYVEMLNSGQVHNMRAQDLVPFCMDANVRYTNSSRIPGATVDRIKSFDHNKVHHTVVIRQGKFYVVQVTTKDGRVFPPSLIKKQLEKVVEMAGDKVDETGIMTFTALPREDWAAIRERLEKDPVNRNALEMIDSSYSLLILDTEAPDLEDFNAQCNHMFHGNMYNRWFDKSFSIIICANGVIGSNVEHSRLDATVAGQGWEYMLQYEEYDEDGRVLQMSEDGFPKDTQPKELEWNLDTFTEDLKHSKDHLRDLIADSDLVVTCPSYGKNIPKKCRLSPDGWFQLALQLTYYRMYHKLVLTYESATTRLYYKGRTETIRPVSMQSKAFVEAMDDSSVSVEKKRELLKAAIQYQEQYKFEAMRGMGVDRHFFGLYIVAKWLKMDPMPEIFSDEAFQMKFHLSTSQTPTQFIVGYKGYDSSKRVHAGGFGTVTDEGYGVSYIISGEETVYFSIHSKRSCPDTDSEKFGAELRKSFEDMKGIYSELLLSR